MTKKTGIMQWHKENINNRKKKVVQEIKKQNEWLTEINRQEKYRKMARSPFSFFRGTNHLFWSDIIHDKRLSQFSNQHTDTWTQGDLHACNIGIFDNALEEIVFDVNDFDESFIGNFQYDVWRMAISIVLIAKETLDLPEKKTAKLIKKFAKQYLKTMNKYDGNNKALSLNFTKENTKSRLKKRLKKTEDEEGVDEMLERWTRVENNHRTFNYEDNEIAKLTDEKRQEIASALPDYGKTLSGQLSYDEKYFKIKDIAERLFAGTGSLGTPRYYVLIDGASPTDCETCRILDIKKQKKPTAYRFMNDIEKAAFDKRFPSQAKRFVEANNVFIRHPDNHLGYMILSDGEYSVRQRSPYKADVEYENIDKKKHLKKQTKQWAKVLATVHARAGDTLFINTVAQWYETNCDEFEKLVIEIALEYANIVDADYQTFLDEVMV